MKYKSLIFLLSFSFGSLFLSCNEAPNYVGKAIKVSCSEDDKISVHSIELIKSIDIVQLQSGDVPVGNVDKIVSCDTFLYILDREIQKVWIFDVKGRYHSTIMGKGHGANEYTELTDIFIDKEHATLNLVCRNDRKILLYDLTGNFFVRQKKLPKSFMSLIKLPGVYIGFMGNYSEDSLYPDNLWIMDDSLSIIGSGISIKPELESRYRMSMTPLSTYNGICYCICQMERDVYTCDSANHIYPLYHYNFGDMNLPKLTKKDIDDPQRMFKIANTCITGLDAFQETDNYLLALCLYHGQQTLIVYNKKNKDSKIVSLDVDEEKYLLRFGRIQGMDDQHIYSTLEPDDVYSVYQGANQYNNFIETHPQQVANLREKLGELQKNDNPYIMIYSVR